MPERRASFLTIHEGHLARASHGRRRSRLRSLRLTGAVILALVAAASAAGLLAFLTPSASTAASLVAREAGTHGIAYPGPEPPRRFAKALVATEDHRFYSPFDPGIDPFAIGRVILARVTGRPDQGGSTIEQQLAKMLYTPGESGPAVEAEEVMLAVKLALTYSKARILSMYAEVAYFGDGYYGLAVASCGYFGKPPADLNWPQAAMLAGVVNAPSADDPRRYPGNAHRREAHVIARLIATGNLSTEEAAAALSRPLGLVPRQLARQNPRCFSRGSARGPD